MSKRIKVTIRVITRNPKLQTVKERRATGRYFVSQIVGVIELPEPQLDEPMTQLLTTGGPVDVYEPAEEVLAAMDWIEENDSASPAA